MELTGAGFTLRRLREEDAEALQMHADNIKIPAYLTDRMPSPYTLKDAEDIIVMCIDQDPITSFAIEIEGKVAGMIGLEFRTDVHRKTPTIGYWLGEIYWRKGIMTEAVKLVTKYGFNNFDIICIQAGVYSKNPPSMRVLEKAGYTLQGIIKGSVFKNGEILDEHIFTAYNNGKMSTVFEHEL